MPGLADILMAAALTQAAHTGGHFIEADMQNVPMGLDVRGLKENWKTPDAEKDALLHGAGYRFQDTLAKASGSPLISGLNGLYKLGYLAKFPQKVLGADIPGDDVNLARVTGNSHVPSFIALGALADFYKAKNPNTKWGLGFWQHPLTGAPGLAGEYRW